MIRDALLDETAPGDLPAGTVAQINATHCCDSYAQAERVMHSAANSADYTMRYVGVTVCECEQLEVNDVCRALFAQIAEEEARA